MTVFKNKNLYIIFCVTLISVMGVASITPAFPSIMKFFGIGPHQVGWLISAFTLPGIFLTPVAGILADRFGRKKILVPSLFLFGAAGFSCMFVRDFHLLLILRFLQGTGASSLASLNITLIGDIFKGEERTGAMGYNASVLSVGTAAYPAIGGVLASLGWPFIFALPVLALPLGVIVLYGLNNPEPGNKANLKAYFGNVWRKVNQGTVWGLFFTNILVFVVLYGAYLTYFPILLGNRFNFGSAAIGGTMSVMSVVTAITSFQLPRINRMVNPKSQLIIATGFYLISMIILSLLPTLPVVILGIGLFGMGHGIIIPAIQNQLVSKAGIQERAAFMSLNSMVLRIGQTLGPLLIGIFYSLGGISTAFLAGGGTAICMFLLILLLLKSPETAQ